MAKSHYGGEAIKVKDAIQNQRQRQHNFGVNLKETKTTHGRGSFEEIK